MANIYRRPEDIPPRKGPLPPGVKPRPTVGPRPVDPEGSEEETEEWLEYLRRVRAQTHIPNR